MKVYHSKYLSLLELLRAAQILAVNSDGKK
jgi:hypothetical protein